MRLNIKAQCCIDEETLKSNIDKSPKCPPLKGSGNLAIVGGGHSILSCIEVLKNWDGKIWAINGAVQWCLKHGIDATLISVDPDPVLHKFCESVKTAIFANHCDPMAFNAMLGATVYKIEGRLCGPTTAVCVAPVAIAAGYSSITYFGCESSYTKKTHAYLDDLPIDLIEVECGDSRFLTKLEFLLQAQRLSEIIRLFPVFFKEVSGGLLRAMINNQDYKLIAATKYVHDRLRYGAE